MRIGVVTNDKPWEPESGVGVYVRQTTLELIRSGHEVTWITPHTEVPERYESMAGLTVAQPSFGTMLPRSRGILQNNEANVVQYLSNQIGMLSAGLTSDEYDIVHCHDYMNYSAANGIAATKSQQLPVMTMHTVYFIGKSATSGTSDYRFREYRMACQKLAISSCGGLSVLTQAAEEDVQRTFRREDILTLPPIENLQLSSVFTKEERDPLDIVYLGRLTRGKGLQHLLGALADAHLPKGWRLSVFGAGPERNRFESLSSSLGLSKHVHFLGHQPRTGVLAAVGAAACVVIPSTDDGVPLSCVEALNLGTPVIASRLPGTELLIDDGQNGILVRPGDVPQLAASLTRVIQNGELRDSLGSSAQTRSAQGARWSDIADSLLMWYQSTLERSSP